MGGRADVQLDAVEIIAVDAPLSGGREILLGASSREDVLELGVLVGTNGGRRVRLFHCSHLSSYAA